MSKNQYKQSTKYFGIPVPGWNDGIWPELELLKWQMVENLLVSAMRGNVNSIFREGDYRITRDGDGTYTVRLSASGNEPSLQGAIAGAYFEAPSSIVWTGLQDFSEYYLYVKGSPKTFYDAAEISTVSSEVRILSKYVTLVGKVDLRCNNPSIDRNPPGKVNARDLASHVLDYDNPHGDKVTQDEILVRKHLALGDGNDLDLELDVNGEVTHIPLSQVVAALKTTNTFADFVSGGKEGVVLTAPGKITFVNVTRTSVDPQNAGETAIGFYGIDSKVKSPNQAIVYNFGEAGISMRAMIVCE